MSNILVGEHMGEQLSFKDEGRVERRKFDKMLWTQAMANDCLQATMMTGPHWIRRHDVLHTLDNLNVQDVPCELCPAISAAKHTRKSCILFLHGVVVRWKLGDVRPIALLHWNVSASQRPSLTIVIDNVLCLDSLSGAHRCSRSV